MTGGNIISIDQRYKRLIFLISVAEARALAGRFRSLHCGHLIFSVRSSHPLRLLRFFELRFFVCFMFALRGCEDCTRKCANALLKSANKYPRSRLGPQLVGKTSIPSSNFGHLPLLAVAAGVVFYGLLAAFPAATALVSLCGLFTRSARSHGQLACYHKSRVADRDVGMSADMIRADALSAAGLYLLLSPTDWTK